MVEELLQLLIDKVDRELLKAVEGEDLKAGDVKDGTEVDFLHAGVFQRLIALLDQPKEGSVVDCSGNSSNGIGRLVRVLTLRHPLSANLVQYKWNQKVNTEVLTFILGFTNAVIKSLTSTSVNSAT